MPAPEATLSPSRVLLVQQVVPHYRRRLFELMHRRLADAGIALQVVYGNANAEQEARHDLVELAPPLGLKVSNLWLTSRLLYQPVLRPLLDADLVIVPNAAAYLPNYAVFLRGRRARPRVGFFVYHTQQRALDRSWTEAVSRRMSRRGDWWFAYTGGTRRYLLQQGTPDERITVLDNSVDIPAFRRELASIGAAEVAAFACGLGIGPGSPVALFCGGLHRDKRLDFLFESLRRMHRLRPDLHLLVVGDGSCRDVVARAAALDPRIHALGARFGREKALCFRLAQVCLCPGLVGLGIQEAFAAGLPLLTTDLPIHSPEIDYLRPGLNGVCTPHDPERYARAVADLLDDPQRLRALARAARCDARPFSVERMAARFCDGIRACLGSEPTCSSTG